LRSFIYGLILFIVCIDIYKDPSIGIGIIISVYTLALKMQDITAKLFKGVASLICDVPYMKDFFYLDTIEKDIDNSDTQDLDNGNIEFDNVCFSYPGSDKFALEHINVKINEGEKVAIVGDNGSGKSTFISLLCGMFEPQVGNIKVGHKLMSEHKPQIRESISVVFQDFGHYEDTIRNNIVLSDNKRIINDKKIIEMLKKININDIIDKQPNGLDEVIGSFNDMNHNLSGGEWQKIAIARAAYRENAKIMILDEPTSALDPIAEAQLYKNFTKLTMNKTTILISHRLGVTSLVDRILVFKGGKIIEDGSHIELIEKQGYYAKMYNAQAQWYK